MERLAIEWEIQLTAIDYCLDFSLSVAILEKIGCKSLLFQVPSHPEEIVCIHLGSIKKLKY
jgi:hypothetical protein